MPFSYIHHPCPNIYHYSHIYIYMYSSLTSVIRCYLMIEVQAFAARVLSFSGLQCVLPVTWHLTFGIFAQFHVFPVDKQHTQVIVVINHLLRLVAFWCQFCPLSLIELIRTRCFMHSLLKGKTNNRKTSLFATMILLTTMASCEASLTAQFIQSPQIFRHVRTRTSTHPIQALHDQPHSSATAVESLLRNPVGFHTTHVERDESNPACSCWADQ